MTDGSEQRYRDYTYSIDVEEVQPIGEAYPYPFVAQVRRMVKHSDKDCRRISPPAQETWGRTSEEAMEKLREPVERWIDEQES